MSQLENTLHTLRASAEYDYVPDVEMGEYAAFMFGALLVCFVVVAEVTRCLRVE